MNLFEKNKVNLKIFFLNNSLYNKKNLQEKKKL
jgi:hypothetical protein